MNGIEWVGYPCLPDHAVFFVAKSVTIRKKQDVFNDVGVNVADVVATRQQHQRQ
jgi:hypothetical protein